MSDTTDLWTVANIEAQAPDQRSLVAARELLREDAFPQIEPTSDGRGWWAVCRGTTDQYRVTVRAGIDGFDCACACPSHKNPCKHAIALLLHLNDRPDLRAATPGQPLTRAPMDFEGLLRAIFAHPEDDTPRLIFADYLDETGQHERAELIRVQCGHGDTPPGERAAREKALLERFADDFDLPDEFTARVARGFVRLEVSTYRFGQVAAKAARVANLFRNGWVESVHFSPAHEYYYDYTLRQWRGEDCALLRQAGCLDFIAVRQTDTQLVQLATDLLPGAAENRLAQILVHPQDADLYAALVKGTPPADRTVPAGFDEAEELRDLDVTAEQLARLLGAGQLDQLSTLTLAARATGDAGLSALASRDGLRLVSLSLSGEGISPAGVSALASAPWFQALARLQITDGRLSAGTLTELRGAARLAELTLHRANVIDADAEALATIRFPALRKLELHANALTETGAAAVLRAEHFPELAEVDFSDNPIPPERWAELVLAARDRPRLDVCFVAQSYRRERVSVSRTISGADVRFSAVHLSDAAVAELARCPALARVTALTLRNQPISAGTAEALAPALAHDRFLELDLSGCTLDDDLATITRFCENPALTTLSLARLGLKYPVVARLAVARVVSNLRVLDLSDNPLGSAGLDALLGSPYLAKVERFVFRGTLGLSQKERTHFQSKFGKRAEF